MPTKLTTLHGAVLRVKTLWSSHDKQNIWFKGKNIAKILGYSDTDQAIRYNVDPKDRKSFPVNCTGYSKRGRPK